MFLAWTEKAAGPRTLAFAFPLLPTNICNRVKLQTKKRIAMPENQIEIQFSSVGYDERKGYFCRISAPKAFARPKTIYGATARDAASNARRFIQLIADRNESAPVTKSGFFAALPAAGAAAAADGPLPVGDVVAATLLMGAAVAALSSTRSSDREARCEAQYEADVATCLSLPTRQS